MKRILGVLLLLLCFTTLCFITIDAKDTKYKTCKYCGVIYNCSYGELTKYHTTMQCRHKSNNKVNGNDFLIGCWKSDNGDTFEFTKGTLIIHTNGESYKLFYEGEGYHSYKYTITKRTFLKSHIFEYYITYEKFDENRIVLSIDITNKYSLTRDIKID